MATSENIPDIKEMDNLLDEIDDDSQRRKKWEQEEEPWSATVQLPKVDDNNKTNLEWSIKACISKNEPETAIDILEKMIQKDPKNAELHYQYAVLIRSHLKDFKRAEKEWLIAVNYDPNHTLALWCLADLYKNELNDYPPSRYYFKRLLKLKPTFGIGWKEYGDLLGWRLNEWKDAVIAYEESIKLEHEYLWIAYNNSAYGYARKLGNPQKGKQYYAKACELGNAAVSWSHLGKINLEFFNNPKDAEPCFRKAIEIKEKQAEAHTFLGQILAAKTDDINAIEEAKKHLIRALELGENRAKETLQEIIKREQKQQQGAQEQEEKKEVESQTVEFFSNNDRVIDILGKASESITASNDAKILCCAGADGEIFLYDLTQMKTDNLSDTKKYTFFKLADHNCNEVQFSHSDAYLAAAFFHPNAKNSKLLIFNISSLKTKGLSPENIASSNVAIHKCQFQTRLFTNAVRFSADDSNVIIGLGLYYAEHCPLYLINTKDGKMDTNVYTQVLLKQCGLNVDNLEGISSLYLVDCILVCGTTHGRIFVIDIANLELLYSYRHRTSATGASRISAVYLTSDLRWIISADIYGAMNFYFIQLQNDMTEAKKTQSIMQKYKTVVGHRLIYDIVFVSEYNDVHFRSVTELQAHHDRLICSSSHDGNLTLFELINEDIYTGAAMVRIISRIESVHEYLPINSVFWRLTQLGLNLFTTGDDKRIIIHMLADILLDALPESLDLKKPHQYKRRYFNMENLSESQQHFETIVVEERHKLNGWINLWAHGNIETERNDTSDMAGAALNTLQILTEPIILNLKEDKVKYERVYARMALDATDTEGLNQINALIENVIRANKSVYDATAKQSKDSLIELMMDAFAADQELQTLAVELSSDPAISGMYEGNPGIKKMKRAVEKTLLRNLEINREFSFDKELDFGYLKDLSRAGITCRDCKAIYTALDKIIKVKKNEVEIVRIKNRFVPESEFGYRDILVNLRFIEMDEENKRQEKYSGHIVELQLHHEKFQNVRKKGKGHANYSATRFMMDFIKISTKLDEYKKGKEEKGKEEKEDKLSQLSPQQGIKRNLNELWNLQLD